MPVKLGSVSAALLVLATASAPPAGATDLEEFCYGRKGNCLQPDEWPDVCVKGNTGRQSPVDIHDSERTGLPLLRFAYGRVPLTVETNGHTLEVVYESTSHHVRVGQRICQLQQFHFHHTAEHPLGGTVYPMEAHLVHDCGPDDLLVVGVMMHYLDDKPNRALATALEYAARDEEGKFVKDTVDEPSVLVDASDLLPRTRGYFTYEGSLTTPPCSETVSWYVLKTPVSVTKEQVDEFTQLLEDTSPNGFPFNNRPSQTVGDRTILSKHGFPSLR